MEGGWFDDPQWADKSMARHGGAVELSLSNSARQGACVRAVRGRVGVGKEMTQHTPTPVGVGNSVLPWYHDSHIGLQHA